MNSPISLLIHTLRRIFYNTPVKNWRITEIIYAQVGRLLIGSNPYPVIHLDGMKLKANSRDVIITAALANGNYEPFALRVFRQLVEDRLAKTANCVFADVGANIGIYTITAALIDPRVQVFAFEPNPVSYGLLLDNVRLNELDNVTAIPSGVGEKRGTASLDVSSPQTGLHSIYGSGALRHEVPLIALDDFFDERHLSPTILKIDIEGYEPRALLGLTKILRLSPLQMIMEFNPGHLKKGGHDPAQFLDLLLAQFNRVSCLDEIQLRAIPYVSAHGKLKNTLLGTGYNLLLER